MTLLPPVTAPNATLPLPSYSNMQNVHATQNDVLAVANAMNASLHRDHQQLPPAQPAPKAPLQATQRRDMRETLNKTCFVQQQSSASTARFFVGRANTNNSSRQLSPLKPKQINNSGKQTPAEMAVSSAGSALLSTGKVDWQAGDSHPDRVAKGISGATSRTQSNMSSAMKPEGRLMM